ncbi:hypothetical protein AKJ64_00530 [candidate division MSBL1 archaeon SCGC-AAA259E17]|uniref:Zinc-hook domain-containing protein n=1 Tax=candidate division MSBL1 archaeon SCGC-AAA259E17 TaxID=1698263 RepID=A0A133UGZ0_9EURY|nr:hypothetical protein AKJ64_00530 [candidate division MSBL1 archaeon SCGC-AAA259E17]
MINEIRLKNWKSHKDTQLELGEGTNVLVGMIGSGKSSVLEAIAYGLFGTVQAVRNRKITLDDLIKKRPKKEDTAEVEIEFTAPNGERYVVRRVLERGKGTTFAELRKADGTLIEKPHSTNVTEYVTSLIQIDYDFFERMIYAEQNQLDRFLTLEPRKRRKRIDELLKINKFEKARKNTSTLINRLRDREEDRSSDLQELRKDDEIQALPSLKKELKETREEREELVEKKEEVKPELERVEKRLDKFQKIEEEVDELSKKIESIRGRIEGLEKQIKRYKDKLGKDVDVGLRKLKKRKGELEGALEGEREKVENLESQFNSATAKLSELKTEKKALEEEVDEIREKIEEKKKSKVKLEEINLPELSEELEDLNEERRQLGDQFSNLKVRIENLNESIEELEEAESTCPVCGRPLSEEMKKDLIRKRNQILERSRSKMSEVKERIDEIEEKISRKEDLKAQAQDLKRDLEDLPDLESKLSDDLGELKEKSEDFERIKKKKKETQERLEEKRKEIEEIRNEFEDTKKKIDLQLDLKSAKEGREEVRDKEERIQKDLQEKKEKLDEELIKDLKEKRQNLIKRQEHYKTRLSEIEKLIKEKEKVVESVEKKKKTLRRRETEVEVLKESINSLGKLRKALSRSQTALRRQVIEAVNGMMNEIWNDIYPYDDFRGIRLSIEEGRKSSDYELQLMDSSGTWDPVEGMTSGGERTCASLNLRIAFAVVLAPNLSWLILDEPTHNLDSEGIDSLSEILRERIPRVVKQLLLITHEKRLESAVSGYLYRFNRDKSRDGPTEVQRVYEEE